MIAPIHHFYHIYADGGWERPISDHIAAIRETGLESHLTSFNVGIVGSKENREAVKAFLDANSIKYSVIAEEDQGWEQTTLTPLYEFIKEAEGFVTYAHTKGAANDPPVNTPWRLHMEYHNFVNWQIPVQALSEGKLLAGCFWIITATAKFYGGTYWWARIDALKHN